MTTKCKCGRFINNKCPTCFGSIPYFCFKCLEDYEGTCFCSEKVKEGKLIDDLDREELELLYDFIGNGVRPFHKTEILFPELKLNTNIKGRPSYSDVARNIRGYCINKMVALDLAKQRDIEGAYKYISITSKCYSYLTPETRTINLNLIRKEEEVV
uniref:Uncharacterized protein n=1 Tax=viral metagenome TaxID=1070528 RepID=A0A6M3L7G6_9ZZZZ